MNLRNETRDATFLYQCSISANAYAAFDAKDADDHKIKVRRYMTTLYDASTEPEMCLELDLEPGYAEAINVETAIYMWVRKNLPTMEYEMADGGLHTYFSKNDNNWITLFELFDAEWKAVKTMNRYVRSQAIENFLKSEK